MQRVGKLSMGSLMGSLWEVSPVKRLFWVLFFPLKCPTTGQTHKNKKTDNHWLSVFCFVPPQGLEPWTPTLRVSCSTNWAKEASILSDCECKISDIFYYCKKIPKIFSGFLSCYVGQDWRKAIPGLFQFQFVAVPLPCGIGVDKGARIAELLHVQVAFVEVDAVGRFGGQCESDYRRMAFRGV